MRSLSTKSFAFAAAFSCLSIGAALAAGDSGSSTPASQCTDGKVWDQKTSKCVDPTRSNLDLDTIYETGRELAKAGRYGEAIRVLSVVADSGDPRVLNYLGFSHRKQGRVTVGLGYYQEALKANPDYTLAREYMGEAYLQMGDIAGARAQLSEIETRCGTACAEYVELDRQIAAHLKGV